MPISITPITAVDIRLVPGDWPLPEALRDSVPERWARLLAANPHLWDGRILGVSAPVVDADGVLRAEAREDAYSAFLAWRDAGFPDVGVYNLFGSALIVSGDGALLFGVMGADTANAGNIYPPGGSLEPRDVQPDGRVDVLGSIALELSEETGLDVAGAEPGNIVVIFDGPRISVARLLRFVQPADALAEIIRANLAAQTHRELADMVILRGSGDAARAGAIPYATAVAEAFFAGRI